MRSLAIVRTLLLAAAPAALLTAAAAQAHDAPAAPQARFHYGDLNLRNPDDRRILVERVESAAADYCRDHAAVVTPERRMGDPGYCPAVMRIQLMWAMPGEVRRAYDQGWRRRPARRN